MPAPRQHPHMLVLATALVLTVLLPLSPAAGGDSPCAHRVYEDKYARGVELLCHMRNLTAIPSHPPSQTSDPTAFLIMTNNLVTLLPADAFAHLPYLHVLDITSNPITRADVHFLRGVPLLKILRMGDTKMKWLPPGAFQPVPNLQILSMADSVQQLDPQLLVDMPRLETLAINIGSLGSPAQLLAPDTPLLQNVPLLSDIALSRQRAVLDALLTHNVLQQLPVLQRLSLEATALQSSPLPTFRNLRQLNYLQASFNFYTNLTSATFQGLVKLAILSMGNNCGVRFVPRGLTATMPAVISVDIGCLPTPEQESSSCFSGASSPSPAGTPTHATLTCTCAPGYGGDGSFCSPLCPPTLPGHPGTNCSRPWQDEVCLVDSTRPTTSAAFLCSVSEPYSDPASAQHPPVWVEIPQACPDTGPKPCSCDSSRITCTNNALTAPPRPPGSGAVVTALSLTNNQLTRLGSYAFSRDYPALAELFLRDQPLQVIEPLAFAGLDYLDNLDLSGCTLHLHATLVPPMPTVRTLDLSNAVLSHPLEGHVLCTLFPNTTTLHMRSLRAPGVDADFLAGCDHLRSLYMLWDEATSTLRPTYPLGFLHPLRQLQNLQLALIQLEPLALTTFGHPHTRLLSPEAPPRLETLIISLGADIPPFLRELTSLRTLELMLMRMTELSPLHFHGLTNLEQIKLTSNTALTLVPSNLFAALPKLSSVIAGDISILQVELERFPGAVSPPFNRLISTRCYAEDVAMVVVDGECRPLCPTAATLQVAPGGAPVALVCPPNSVHNDVCSSADGSTLAVCDEGVWVAVDRACGAGGVCLCTGSSIDCDGRLRFPHVPIGLADAPGSDNGVHVVSLDMSHNKLLRIRRNSLSVLPNLYELVVAEGQLQSLGSISTFAALPVIDDFYLGRNNLSTLDVTLVEYLSPRLVSMRISQNRFTSISLWNFGQMPRLSRLELTGNPLAASWWELPPALAAAELPPLFQRLTSLDLSITNLRAIPSWLKHMPKLDKLYAASNPITEILVQDFEGAAFLSSLKQLKLEINVFLDRVEPGVMNIFEPAPVADVLFSSVSLVCQKPPGAAATCVCSDHHDAPVPTGKVGCQRMCSAEIVVGADAQATTLGSCADADRQLGGLCMVPCPHRNSGVWGAVFRCNETTGRWDRFSLGCPLCGAAFEGLTGYAGVPSCSPLSQTCVVQCASAPRSATFTCRDTDGVWVGALDCTPRSTSAAPTAQPTLTPTSADAGAGGASSGGGGGGGVTLAAVGVVAAVVVVVVVVALVVWRQRRQTKVSLEQQSLEAQVLQMQRLEQRAAGLFQREYAGSSLGPRQPLVTVPAARLALGRELGAGEFSMVYLAQLQPEGEEGRRRAESGQPVAVKTVGRQLVGAADVEVASVQLLLEAQLMRLLAHPNIVPLLGICTDRPPPQLVLPYMAGGDLKTLLRGRRTAQRRLRLDEQLLVARQVAAALGYLARVRVVHRDVAARNVFVGDSLGDVRLGDFGLSRDVYASLEYRKLSEERLPFKWMALESVRDHVFTTQSDVWSFGVLLWEIATHAQTPYPAMQTQEVLRQLNNGYRMPRPDGCSQGMYEVMRACWRERPQDRPAGPALEALLERVPAGGGGGGGGGGVPVAWGENPGRGEERKVSGRAEGAPPVYHPNALVLQRLGVGDEDDADDDEAECSL